MLDEIWFLLAAVGTIAIVAGFLHSAIGFGFGIVAISLLPFVIDARSAHIVVSVSSVPMLIMAAWTYREGIERRTLAQAMLGSAIFLPLGVLLFEQASLDLLVRMTGLGIFAMVMFSLRRQDPNDSTREVFGASFFAGAVAGFLGGAVSIAGPPIAAFALKRGWSQARYKAFVTQCLLVIASYKTGLLFFRSHVVGPVVWQIVLTAILAIIGVQVGAAASRGIPARRFRQIVAVTLLLVSCLMMWRGQSGSSPPASTQIESLGIDERRTPHSASLFRHMAQP